jgi:hypothetical protein
MVNVEISKRVKYFSAVMTLPKAAIPHSSPNFYGNVASTVGHPHSPLTHRSKLLNALLSVYVFSNCLKVGIGIMSMVAPTDRLWKNSPLAKCINRMPAESSNSHKIRHLEGCFHKT